MSKSFLVDYFNRYTAALDVDVSDALIEAKAMLQSAKASGKKVIVAGNGGSAAMSSHVAVDLTKQAGIRTMCFNDADLITCFANDFGYEHWLAKAIEFYCDEGDVVILISSSGQSVNMINAAKQAKKQSIKVITCSGFDANNPLRQEGEINLWLDSKAYNIVENVHLIWLLAICDMIIGNAEYSA